MQKIADITFQDNRFLLSGELDFFNVMSVYQKSLQPLNKSQEWIFDFSQLKSSDSAGLALIIEWIKLAKEASKPVQFKYLSEDILSLAKAAGVDVML
jgi:phospholipid transport system transporter-binding protein